MHDKIGESILSGQTQSGKNKKGRRDILVVVTVAIILSIWYAARLLESFDVLIKKNTSGFKKLHPCV